MGGATLVLGLLPTYAQIGALAPLLLMLMRLIQGFSLGGEFTGSMVYTTEGASPLMRGLVSSSTAAGTTIGFILGSGLRLARQLGDGQGRRRRVGLAHPVHRQHRLLHRRLVPAARHRRNRSGPEGRGHPAAALPLAGLRLAARRPDVRHRRDDQRRVLPDVHLCGGKAEGRNRRRGVSPREHAGALLRRARVEAAGRVAVGQGRPAAADAHADRRDDGGGVRLAAH